MTLSGIADEASPVLDEQLDAYEELGWPRARGAQRRSQTLRILFDTGNAVGDGGGRGDSLKFYEAARRERWSTPGLARDGAW